MVCLCQGLQSKTVQEVAVHSTHLQFIKCIFIQKLHKICKLLIPSPILLYLAANSTRRLYRALSTHCLQIKLSQNLKNLLHHSVNRCKKFSFVSSESQYGFMGFLCKGPDSAQIIQNPDQICDSSHHYPSKMIRF
jgi:hypothetical protein